MQKVMIKNSLLDFKNALGINNFSKELSETEFRFISIVAEAEAKEETINLTTISEQLKVTRSAITQIANKLQEKDYVEKYTLPTNKKEIYLKTGKKAIEQYNKIMEKISYFFEKLFDEIGQEGMDNLERYISISKKIGYELKEKGEEYVAFKKHCKELYCRRRNSTCVKRCKY